MSTQQSKEDGRTGTTIHVSDKMHEYLKREKEERGISSFDTVIRELRSEAEKYELLQQLVDGDTEAALSSVTE